MILDWFDAGEAAEAGAMLADQFASQTAAISQPSGKKAAQMDRDAALQVILQRADRDVRTLRLNFYKKAKFANSFKWRLLEKGVEKDVADEITQRLVMHLSVEPDTAASPKSSSQSEGPKSTDAKYLLAQGNKSMTRGSYSEAIAFYQDLVSVNPRDSVGLNNLGAALCKVGRFKEAEERFREAVQLKPAYPDAHANLGTLLRWQGHITESETSLRCALKLKPNYVEARNSLGLTLVLLGRLRDARARFEKTLKVSNRNIEALLGMGQVAAMEGRFEDAEAMYQRVLAVNPKMPTAWAALTSLRKMTLADGAWLKSAEEIAASAIAPLEAADLRFAIGKYYDDIKDFPLAFENYRRANEVQKSLAERYDRDERTVLVDDLIRAYPRATVGQIKGGASTSSTPVFVVGMMRSGTSLAEQIIASHPSALGAGELTFWNEAAHEHEAVIRQGTLDEPLRAKLAEGYLRGLAGQSTDALRIVDKTPVNSDYLGVIHSVFPKARIIYMQRDPIDTCLSCYFQQFSPALNFTMDLADLAHYYREHHRLMAHWRAVLPSGTILEVPYAELVADQEQWTHKILQFLGLEWDDKVLEFHTTQRPVVTASFWQVRQKIYKQSVQRWRNYERFIGPLLGLNNLSA